jgi:2-C-methyl-D-erythritol 4-phosphate cytidylyltransferase
MKGRQVTVVLAAAGAGVRLAGVNSSQPKQFSDLAGIPMFIWSLITFLEHVKINEIILVVPDKWQTRARDLILEYVPQFIDRVKIIAGGQSRQESVYLGLEKLAQQVDVPMYVMIHDAARPFIDSSHIDKIIETLQAGSACTLGIPVSDSLKSVKGTTIVDNLERDGLFLMQTPQAAEFKVMLAAHRQARQNNCATTDDAAIMQAYGVAVQIVSGSRFNLKITEKDDLLLARVLKDSFGWRPGKVEAICEMKI